MKIFEGDNRPLQNDYILVLLSNVLTGVEIEFILKAHSLLQNTIGTFLGPGDVLNKELWSRCVVFGKTMLLCYKIDGVLTCCFLKGRIPLLQNDFGFNMLFSEEQVPFATK